VRANVNQLFASIEFAEEAIERAWDARLSCIGATVADVPDIGTAHRTATTDINVATLGMQVYYVWCAIFWSWPFLL
jgi:hypothetical protein